MEQGLPILDQIITLITSRISPERIVLFGSYARGDNTKKSEMLSPHEK